jgi:hypothetical protein
MGVFLSAFGYDRDPAERAFLDSHSNGSGLLANRV